MVLGIDFDKARGQLWSATKVGAKVAGYTAGAALFVAAALGTAKVAASGLMYVCQEANQQLDRAIYPSRDHGM
jgi:hypothetical protein